MNTRFCFALLAGLLLASRSHADTTLVFNELMYHPATNEPLYEWVEFYNQNAVDVDVSNWRLAGDIEYTFPPGARVAGRSFLVLAANPAALTALTGVTNVVGPYTGSTTNRISNNGGDLRLYNNAGRLVDRLGYDVAGEWPVAPDGSGVSLAKRDRDFGTANPANWTISAVGGTPGVDNFALVSNVRLIGVDGVWKYDATGTDLGTGWRAPGFNESGWSSRSNLTSGSVAVFSTGKDANNVVLAPNTVDPHYRLLVSPAGAVNTNALAIQNHGSWLANDSASTFIGVRNPGTENVPFGPYNYETTFPLTGYILSSVQLNISVTVDNDLTNVFLNGAPLGLAYSGFSAFGAFPAITTGFVPGTNTLEFRTVNAGTGDNPFGFRAVISGTGLGAVTNSPLPGGLTTYYFRNTFTFPGDPRYATLTLTPVVADGAVFYLNGVEIHRQNMPAGTPGYGTAAISNAVVGYGAPVTISTSNLLVGANVLAVEVHQAAGSPDGPMLGADLSYSSSPVPAVPLVFNEHNGASNAVLWIEIMNYGPTPLALDGCVIRADGATNHDYAIPAGTTVPAGGFFVVSNATLGFHPITGNKLYLYSPSRLAVFDSILMKNGPRARSADGTGAWYVPTASTPGAANNVSLRNDIVINEIMYSHALSPAPATNLPPQANPEQWIELFNRGTNTVDLSRWEIEGGIRYKFQAGRLLAPGGYLVIAQNASQLAVSYPSIDIVGDLNGSLSGADDLIVLTDPLGNLADEVHYYDKGRWPGYADGGGSSLELRDPAADNSRAEAWAASDESAKTGWRTYSYRMVAAASATPAPDAQWREFVFGLLGGGECWIDDFSVIQNPTNGPIQIISNGNFEGGITGWRQLGTHGRSRVETDPLNTGNKALHLVATGPQEHMHNHVETTLNGATTVVNGALYEISFRARWIAGGNLLNTRLYFNRCARTTALPMAPLNGTPGAVNSRYATNIGPTFAAFTHTPVIPAAAQPVSVSVAARDPQGVASCAVWYSLNGGAWSNAAMALSNGLYAGTIPGQAAGTLVQFHVRAVDALGAASTFPATGSNSAALYRVNDGLANVPLAHNIRILMSPANTALMHASTNVMSNEVLPATVIYDERIVYYDMAVRLKSSERGRDNPARVGFHIEFHPDNLYRGVHPVMLIDRSNGGSRPPNEEILLRHMVLKAGVPMVNPDLVRVLAPQASQNGPAIMAPRYEDEFVDAQYDHGGDGTLFELELTYYPTTANAAGYKLPQPDGVDGSVDYGDHGSDKERYRYNFIMKNHRDEDDYSRFLTFAKPFSLTGTQLLNQTAMTMDIDQWMRAYAMISLCGVGDMYTFGNNHNFMTYLRPDGKMLYLPWDMDFSFNNATTAALVGNMRLANIVNLTPNLRRFYAYMLDHISTTYNTAYMNYWIAHYGPFVGQNYSGDAAYIQARGDYARATIASAGGNTPFAVNGNPVLTNSSGLLTLTGAAPVGVFSILVNGNEYPITWNTLSSWTLTLPLGAASNNLDIAGYDVNGAQVTNAARTVHYTGSAVPDPRGVVVFNEVMFNPYVPDASYVELFNTSSNVTYDLGGWSISGVDFTFPGGGVISPRQYLTIVASEAAYLGAYGAGAGIPAGEFSGNLQNNGETLTLQKPGVFPAPAVVVDKIRYDSELPWPVNTSGTGSSVQLIDAAQENARVGNWSALHTPALYQPDIITPAMTNDGWRFVSITTNAGSIARLLIYPDGPGTVWLDDISIVPGTNAATGVNSVFNGDFETLPLSTNTPGVTTGFGWTLGTNMTTSAIVNDLVHSGSGALKLVVTAGAPSTLNRMLTQNLSPAPANGQTCTLSFWYWATNTATNLLVRMQSANLNVTTNLNIFIIPSNYTPAQIISAAIPYASPGAANHVATNLPAFQNLWINELQTVNATGLADSHGEREPWIELHNPGTNAVSLDGLYLTTTFTNLTNWAFPAGHSIPAGGFKVIFCDNQPGQTTNDEIHAGIRLANISGSVALSRLHNGKPQTLDYVNHPALHSDHSFGSFPDGQPFERIGFFYVTPAGTNDGRSAPLGVFINEWMAGNTDSLADPADGDFEDWFEIYNPGTNAVDLAGYYLSDTLGNPFRYLITTNGPHIIPAGGHLLVWADDETAQNIANGIPRADLHVDFSISLQGEILGIFAADGTAIDTVTFGTQTNDVSQGRYPDGGAGIEFMPNTVTPRAANSIGAALNTPPVLAAIGPRLVYLGHTLSFTAAATDADLPAQLLSFTLDPGAPLGAAISTIGAFIWTPTAAGNYLLTVRVTDGGVPNASDGETIAVEVVNHPAFTGLVRNGANFEIGWESRPGRAYRVEYKDDLNAAAWTLLQDLTATGASLSLTNGTASPMRRFYRVTVLP